MIASIQIVYYSLNPMLLIEQASNTPEFLLFLGRFHPLILHLPIGGILLTFYFDILGRIRKNYPEERIKNGLGFSAFFAVVACVFGYLLSLEGGYENNTTNIHMWTGIGTAVLITALYLIKRYKHEQLQKIFLPLFVSAIILISIAGHYGSMLTHGDDFLTQYSPIAKKEKKPEVIDSLYYFSDVIHPILDAKCVQCHNQTKQKGELSFISESAILKGGVSGKTIQLGNSINSALIKRILLPLEDEEHMPPKGKTQITEDELWILRHWIDNGADFNERAIAFGKNDTLIHLLDNYIEKEVEKIPEASIEGLNAVVKAGFSVHRKVTGQPQLVAKFVKDSISTASIQALKNISEQLIELSLNNTLLTDDMTEGLKYLKRIEILRLDNTKISSKTLDHLVDLNKMKVLNLHHTNIDSQGVEAILNRIELRDIYVWNTQAEKVYLDKLQNPNQTNIHFGVFDGFTKIEALQAPTLVTEKTIFSDSLLITFNKPLRRSKLYYTLDGSDPDSTSIQYTAPITIKESAKLKAKLYQKGWLPSETMEKDLFKIKYKINDYNLVNKPSSKYPGVHKIFDFVEGSTLYSDGKWTGYEDENLITTVHFDETKPIESISVSCLRDAGSWILFPKKIEIFAKNPTTSFKKIGELNYDATHIRENVQKKKKNFVLKTPKTQASDIKIVVHNVGKLPKWHQGAGQKGWLFVDEILIQ